MTVRMRCKIVSFEEVHKMIKRVSEQVKDAKYKPMIVVGLARGGWIPARLMCDFLGVTDLLSLKVEHWLQTGRTKDEATIKYPLSVDLSGKKILVVDDITDTGKSLIKSTRYLQDLNPKEIKTATMQYLPNSKFKPNYFAEEVKIWTWFIYPWNWIEDTSTIIIRLMRTEKDKSWSLDDIIRGLKEFFEIKWSAQMLKLMLKIMEDRSQIQLYSDLKYKLKDGKVIQL